MFDKSKKRDIQPLGFYTLSINYFYAKDSALLDSAQR